MSDDQLTMFGGTYLLAIGPLLFIFLGKYAFTGLVRGKTLTHFGLRAGWLARIYGLFYLLLFIYMVIGFLSFVPSYLSLGLATIINTLLLPLPRTENTNFVGLIFISVGIFALILNGFLRRFIAWRYPERIVEAKQERAAKLYLYDYFVTLEVSGLFVIIGAPMGLLVFAFAASGYIFPVLGVNIEDMYPPPKTA